MLPIDDRTRRAYLKLLYRGMVDIRNLQSGVLSFSQALRLLFNQKQRRHIQRAGAIADWLHNLAYFAASDFEGFDEDRFWSDFDYLCKQHPQSEYFRRWFAESLEGENINWS